MAASPATIRSTLSATARVLPPTCRVMLSNAAGLPSPAMMRTWSSVPTCTVATSRTRNPFSNTTAAMSSGVWAS